MLASYKKIGIAFLASGLLLTACATVHHDDNQYHESKTLRKDKRILAANADIRLGMLFLGKDDVVFAKQKFLAALNLAPKYPPSWYAMGYYLEVTGETEAAKKYYKTAIKFAPMDGNAQNNYGTFLCHTGQFAASLPHFIAAAKDPDYSDNAAAYENAGICALMIPDVTTAKAYFTKAVTQNPNKVRSLVYLAEIDYKQKHYLQAHALLKHAMEVTKPTKVMLALDQKIKQHL